jgi:hypothetical protein
VTTAPAPTAVPAAESYEATPMGTPPSATPESSGSHVRSERLPDPEKFEGDRKDLRRFVSQIKEKLNVNRDRYPTPQSRMTYVTNRLKGAPYAQILPYIHEGACQLSDFAEILDILERAFGDPNRTRNARNELYRLRQGNKEFSAFFAEFQRLAMEGEMPDAALPTMLEQAINRELKGMLLHHDPPSGSYHDLARFLQNLENRRTQYESNQPTVPRTFATAIKSNAPAALKPTEPVLWRRPVDRTTTPPPMNPDAMDLSTSRRFSPARQGYSRQERRECFRCGSKDHFVRNCPHPDTRPVTAHQMTRRTYSPRPVSPPYEKRGRSPPHGPSSYESVSPDRSTKGVSLA